MVKEHRRSVRHKIIFRLVFDDGDSYNVGQVDNISEIGLFLESPKALPIDTIVHLEPIEQEEDELFEVKARVVRCTDLDKQTDIDGEVHHGLTGIGLEFVDVNDETRTRIGQMIEKLEAIQHEREQDARDPILGIRVHVGSGTAEPKS